MNFFEWLGFFISMMSVLFLVGKAVYDTMQNQKNPSKYRAQQDEAERRFKAFLRGDAPPPTVSRVLREVIEEDEDEEEEKMRVKQSRPKQVASTQYKYQSPQRQEAPSPPPDATATAPAFVIQTRNSVVKNVLSNESTPKNMVILFEVFGPPKGLR